MGELNNGNISNLFWSTDGKTWHKVEGPIRINFSDDDSFPDLGPLEIVPNE